MTGIFLGSGNYLGPYNITGNHAYNYSGSGLITNRVWNTGVTLNASGFYSFSPTELMTELPEDYYDIGETK